MINIEKVNGKEVLAALGLVQGIQTIFSATSIGFYETEYLNLVLMYVDYAEPTNRWVVDMDSNVSHRYEHRTDLLAKLINHANRVANILNKLQQPL